MRDEEKHFSKWKNIALFSGTLHHFRISDLLWFVEESIFNENVDEEEKEPLDDHCQNVASCDVPTKCWAHEILTLKIVKIIIDWSVW